MPFTISRLLAGRANLQRRSASCRKRSFQANRPGSAWDGLNPGHLEYGGLAQTIQCTLYLTCKIWSTLLIHRRLIRVHLQNEINGSVLDVNLVQFQRLLHHNRRHCIADWCKMFTKTSTLPQGPFPCHHTCFVALESRVSL